MCNQIYNMFFIKKMKVTEIAKKLKVDKSYISRILKKYYNNEFLLEKEKRKELNKTSEMMDKDGLVHKLYFIEGKTVSEIASILGKTQPYITIILQTYPEYKIEKERRKALNREKQNFLDEDECHYKYRDRPLMPQETLSTISFIKMNRQSYITDGDGNLIFDKSRGGLTKDLPRKYSPIIW